MKCLYRLVKLDLLFQVLLHDPVVVVDTVAMEVVHLSCATNMRGETSQFRQCKTVACTGALSMRNTERYLVKCKTWC